MSKKKGTAESKLKPGSPKNLDIAIWGNLSDPTYTPMHTLVHGWLNDADAKELARKHPDPESAKKIETARRKLATETLQFLIDAIINNRPNDLIKLADVVERTHESKQVDQSGNISFPAASPEVYRVLIFCFLKQQKDPGYKFSFAEIKDIVADAQGIEKIDRPNNEALTKRTQRVIAMLGLSTKTKQDIKS